MKTPRLKLNLFDLCFHYIVGLLFLIGGIALICSNITKHQSQLPSSKEFIIASGLLMIFLGVLSTIWLYRKLYFRGYYVGEMPIPTFQKIAKKVLKQHHWGVLKENEIEITAWGRWFKFKEKKWWQPLLQLTLFYQDGTLWVNCVEFAATHRTTFGRARKNCDDFAAFFLKEIESQKTSNSSSSSTQKPITNN